VSWKAALAGGVVLGLIAGGLGARQLFDRSTHPGEDQRAQLTFTGQAGQPALSPDGAFVAYVDIRCEHAQVDLCRSSLLVQEVGSTQAVPILSGAQWLDPPRWSHDGATVVVGGQLDSARTGLFAIPRLGGAPRPLGPGGPFDTHPSGDTVVVVRDRDSASVALITRLADGRVVDSVALHFGQIRAVSWAPEGRRLAFTTRLDVLKIVARNGRETASAFRRIRRELRWTVNGDAILAFQTGIAREDELVRFGVDGEGRFQGGAEVVMSRVPTLYKGEFDVARRTGRVALATGTSNLDLWTFELTSGNADGQRRTRGTTWYGSPTLSPDGSTAFYLRGDALGDNVYSLRLSDGTEEALTSQRSPGWDAVRISDDGHRLVYGHSGEKSRFLEVLELPSRQVESREVTSSGDLDWPVGRRGILRFGASGNLVILDSLEGPERALGIPDSLTVFNFAPAPDGERVAFLAGVRPFPSRVVLFGTVSLDGQEIRILKEFKSDEAFPSLTWDRDGGIYLGRWLWADAAPSIWRMTAAGNDLVRVATLSAPCTPGTVVVAAGGRAAICQVEDNRSDIWIVEGIGLGR
jgi:Tol biopolymer transport system component